MAGEADTIFAIASGGGRAAVTLMRISGPECGAIVAGLCGRLPAPRRASLRRLRDRSGDVLDQALVLWFPGPGSYTGEDCAELHLHGGRAVAAAVAGALAVAGARPAEPGEFSRRAFLAGRLDLLQAEAIADLVAAETEGQRRQALRQMEGALGKLYSRWSDELTHLLAGEEALIDFPDEDLPPEVEATAAAARGRLEAEIAAHLADRHRGERLREGLVFAIVGPPNAGKSTLLNALAAREVAIVSPLPGTTRDVLEVRLDLDGVPVTLLDTAGLRETGDPVEAEGVRRARDRAASADLVIELIDATSPSPPPLPPGREAPMVLRVASKVDLAPAPGEVDLAVAPPQGRGLAALRAKLAACAREMTENAGPPALTRERHRAALIEALARLRAAGTAPLPELRAEELRQALWALGQITGRVGVEEILDSVFGQFCIGK